MKLFNIITIIAISLSLFSCNGGGKSNTQNAVEYGDDLRNAINDFENKRKNFSDKITDLVKNTDSELSKENPAVEKVAEDWEVKWKNIIAEFKIIESDFTKVGESSAVYFQRLEELSLSIKDEKIKVTEQTKNKKLKERWTETFKEAAASINKVRQILHEGNDFHKVLLAETIRGKIDKNIEALKSISKRARNILIELENFTAEGKKLVNA